MEADEKVCPYYAETIKAAAIKCRWCGESLTEPSTTTTVDSSEHEPTGDALAVHSSLSAATDSATADLPGSPDSIGPGATAPIGSVDATHEANAPLQPGPTGVTPTRTGGTTESRRAVTDRSKAGMFFRVFVLALLGLVFVGPILGPILLVMKVEAKYEIPGQFLGTIKLDCGSVLHPREEPRITDAYSWSGGSQPDTALLRGELQDKCDTTLASYRGFGIGLLIVGSILWIVAIIAWIKTKSNPVEFLKKLGSGGASRHHEADDRAPFSSTDPTTTSG